MCTELMYLTLRKKLKKIYHKMKSWKVEKVIVIKYRKIIRKFCRFSLEFSFFSSDFGIFFLFFLLNEFIR